MAVTVIAGFDDMAMMCQSITNFAHIWNPLFSLWEVHSGSQGNTRQYTRIFLPILSSIQLTAGVYLP
jgi:hypothetical protein